MTRNRTLYLAAVVGLLELAITVRLVPLYWSPYPATLDGIYYAALARQTITAGQLPLTGFRADSFTSVLLLSFVSHITAIRPLTLAQPLYAIVGGTTPLLGIVLVRRLGHGAGWPRRRVRLAAILAGLGLALEGLYVRRTGVPDDDALTLLLIPILVLLPILVVLPITHTFATLIAALGGTVLLATQLGRDPDRRTTGLCLGLVGGFWLYFSLYSHLASTLGLTVPYIHRVTDHPGLFLAWVIVLIVGVRWLPRASHRLQRGTYLGLVGGFFVIAIVNLTTTVFPGTVRTPRLVALLLVPLGVIVVLATRSVPLVAGPRTAGAVVLALFAAPIVLILFGLTAALTPEFFATVMRAQTFAHQSVLIVAALTTARLAVPTQSPSDVARRQRWLGRLTIVVFVVGVALTTPLAVVDLDTGAAPSTTTEPEFAAATFAVHHLDDQWTSGHAMARIAGNYYTDVNVTITPTATWVRGGPPPACPAISQRTWATHGVHLFPTGAGPVSTATYQQWLSQRHLVYTTSGHDPVGITLARGGRTSGC